jgi:hypothetical protein
MSSVVDLTLGEEERTVSQEIQRLLDKARQKVFSAADQEAQRRSFAFGNTKFENERITRETVDRAAESLKAEHEKNGRPARQ